MCIRPQTYEDESEAEVLSWVFADRSGSLRNTSFGILSSDGERKLSSTGRSPSMVYGTPEKFVAALREIAGEERIEKRKPIEALPELPDLRVALGVAAADLRPLIVVHATKAAARRKLVDDLQETIWAEAFVGRFRFAVLDDEDELEGYDTLELEPGISIVRAEPYGRDGEVLLHASRAKSTSRLEALLANGLKRFGEVSERVRVRDHLRRGRREGIEREPAPEDPASER